MMASKSLPVGVSSVCSVMETKRTPLRRRESAMVPRSGVGVAQTGAGGAEPGTAKAVVAADLHPRIVAELQLRGHYPGAGCHVHGVLRI